MCAYCIRMANYNWIEKICITSYAALANLGRMEQKQRQEADMTGNVESPSSSYTESAKTSGAPRLLNQVRIALRFRHYSLRTERTYVHWIKRYIHFHGLRHPREMGAPEVTAFLSHLAVKGRVASSTQNQALAALLFLYKQVFEIELPWMTDIERSKRPKRLPVVSVSYTHLTLPTTPYV